MASSNAASAGGDNSVDHISFLFPIVGTGAFREGYTNCSLSRQHFFGLVPYCLSTILFFGGVFSTGWYGELWSDMGWSDMVWNGLE